MVFLSLPDGDAEEPGLIELVELDADGGSWAGGRSGRPDAYGTVAEVVGALTSRLPSDPWVSEVAAALARERGWTRHRRRSRLAVVPGHGDKFHATAAVNRESIRRHGLDWRQMGAAPGIAGSLTPEVPGIFVCDDVFDVRFFVRMARSATDIWSVQADGLWLESGPDGWWIISQPISPERLTLVERDIAAP
jgi:hypothetical protein